MSASVDRVVIVGASLAGLRAAEALRDDGFGGRLVIVGDEPRAPYDRPPLSKQVLLGDVDPSATALPRLREIDAEWRLGVAAVGLDRAARVLRLADGSRIAYDRLLVATGTRARFWRDPEEAAFGGVFTLRSGGDAAALRDAIARPGARIAVIGGGFNGAEIASACRARDLPVTLIEAGVAPLAGALGATIAAAAHALHVANGVDLRCGVAVERLLGDARNRVRAVRLADGSEITADVVVIAQGSVPNVEWLDGAGLAIGPHGAACDPACRAYDRDGIATDDVFVAGDAARFPHPLFGFEFVTLEHWGNAIAMGRVAAANMRAASGRLRPHTAVPAFWSSQFGVAIKSVGIPALADRVLVAQGSLESGEFVALYGQGDRLVAAVAFDAGKWLPHYEALIASRAAFPVPPGMDAPRDEAVRPAAFAARPGDLLHTPTTPSGHAPVPPHPVPSRLETRHP